MKVSLARFTMKLVLSSLPLLLLLFLVQLTPTRGLCGGSSTFSSFLPSSLSSIMSSRTITTTALNNQNKGDDHEKKMVLITGANKGIGKEITRLIGSTPGYCVLLACRNVALGMETANELQFNPSPLDDFHEDDKDDNDEEGDMYQQQQQQCNVIALPYSFDLTNIQSIQIADDPVGYISLRKYVGQTEDSSLCGIPTTVQLDSS